MYYKELPDVYYSKLLSLEGDVNPDPNDRGNQIYDENGKIIGYSITVKGITKNALDEAIKSKIVPNTVTLENLSDKYIRTIYNKLYYLKNHCNKIPHPLAFAHFDCSVNMGLKIAAKILQSTILETSHYPVEVDGIIGLKTLQGIETIENSEITNITIATKVYNNLREKKYRELAASPVYKDYLVGWLLRLNKVREFCRGGR